MLLRIVALFLLIIALALPWCWPQKQISGTLLRPELPSHPQWSGTVRHSRVGAVPLQPAMMLHCQIADLQQGYGPEILACDHNRRAVVALRRSGDAWEERTLAHGIPSAAHLQVHDLDGDGDQDIAVAVLGDLYPNENKVGSIVLLEQKDGAWVQHKLPFQLRRVADVQAADLDGDGDQDLIVAEFGHHHGTVRWLECTDRFTYTSHILHRAPGAIHVVVNDYDNDGDEDFAVCVSQHDEEVLLFVNQGQGQFETRQIFKSINYDLGMSGLIGCDIDSDGDQDLILSCGDNFENSFHYPQPYHGCYLLRNEGDLQFESIKIADIPGCYGACAGDFDGDGDIDIAAVSMINEWHREEAASLYFIEQGEGFTFTVSCLSSDPIQMVSCDSGDTNGDGRAEILTSCLHLFPPFERFGRLDLWDLQP